MYCVECGKDEVIPIRINYNTKVKRDGKLSEVTVRDMPIHQCQNCGENWFDVAAQDAIEEAVQQELNKST